MMDNPILDSLEGFGVTERDVDHLETFIDEQNEIMDICRKYLKKSSPDEALFFLEKMDDCSRLKAQILGVFPWSDDD